MYITRAWMSAGKCVRLVQMMGLHRIDKHGSYIGIIPEAKSLIELEERRRTFWAAYLSDRYASKCSGWPMAINEHEVWMFVYCLNQANVLDLYKTSFL